MKTRRNILWLVSVFLILGSFILVLFTFGVLKEKDIRGRQINPEEAQLVAKARMHTDLKTIFAGKKYSDIRPLEYEGLIIGYVVEYGDVGWMVVSPNIDTNPVIAWSRTDAFDYRSFYAEVNDPNANPIYLMMREDLLLRHKFARDGLIPKQKREKNRALWDLMIRKGAEMEEKKGTSRKRSYRSSKSDVWYWPEQLAWAEDDGVQYWPEQGTTSTGGWAETLWHQGSPYNELCPIDPNTNNRCLVGCVATALSQIINYHRYIGDPSFSTFRSQDRYVTENGIYIDEDSEIFDFPCFDELNANLEALRETYGNDYPLDDVHKAALCFAVGVSVTMNYGSGMSGTVAYPNSLTDKFGYVATSISPYSDDFYTVLSNNMQTGKPVMLSLTGAGGGHAVVCDGYNTFDEYHINYGSGFNGWYSLTGMPGYSAINSAIVNIEPLTSYGNGTIDGNITLNWEGGNVEDVEVLIEKEGELWRRVYPDSYGYYSADVPPGTYDVTAWSDECEPQTINDIIVGLDEVVSVDFSLDMSEFIKISEGLIVTEYFLSTTGLWGDYNNDGNLDILVLNCGNPYNQNFPYENNGDGTFTKITDGPIIDDGGFSNGGCWADYDNDGHLDLFVANSSGNNFLYNNNGDGTFTKITEDPVVNDEGNSKGGCWADYDNDGYLDLFAANTGPAHNFLYNNNGDGTFTKVAEGPVADDTGCSFGACWGDYNNDGYQDLFVTNAKHPSSNRNFLYINNGDGTFTKITEGPIVNDNGHSQGACLGDYDNDGDLDIFVVNSSAGYGSLSNSSGENNSLYINNGDGTFIKAEEDSAGFIVIDGGNSYAACCGDYDNDGDLDIFVANYGDINYLYRNNGEGFFARVTEGLVPTDQDSKGAAWGDYNNDGYLDLFVANYDENSLYRNRLSGNNWIKIKCEGISSNRFGIGAKVRVRATINGITVEQMREATEITHFGLGNAEQILEIRVEWASGIVNILNDIDVNQTLTITEQLNQPPVLAEIGDKTVNAGATLNFTVSAEDPDSDTLTFSADPLPTGANFEEQTFTWIPGADQVGTYSVTFTVTDNGVPPLSDEETITIQVESPNQPPVLADISNKIVNEGATLSFTVSAEDLDSDTLIFSADPLPTGANFEEKTFTWSPGGNQIGVYSVTFTATDDGEPQLSDEETITIQVKNLPPPSPAKLIARVSQHNVYLEWKPVSDSNLVGYNVYVKGRRRDLRRYDVYGIKEPSGLPKMGWVKLNDRPIPETHFNIQGIANGIYYFIVIAEDRYGLLSGPSNIVEVNVTGF